LTTQSATGVADPERSTAAYKLAAWQRHGLVSERKLVGLTDETRAAVKVINEKAR
jgi:hypothetical protein